MNLEAISQIAFTETFSLPADLDADRIAPVDRVITRLESLCGAEMQRHLDGDLIFRAGMTLRQRGAARCGAPIEACCMVIGIGDREATFSVEARIGARIVVDADLRFVVVGRGVGVHRAALSSGTHGGLREVEAITV